MRVQSVENQQNFNGRVIVLGTISANQKALFNLHKESLEHMISSKPYDIFVKQSKSKKTITLSTDKDCKTGYIVRKNRQDFEKVAKFAIDNKDRTLEIERREAERLKLQEKRILQKSIKFLKELF